SAAAGARTGNRKSGVTNHVDTLVARRLSGNLDVGRSYGAPAVAVHKLNALRERVTARVFLLRQAHAELRADDPQSRGSSVDLYVVDRLAGARARCTDCHAGIERIDCSHIRGEEPGRSTVDYHGLHVGPARSVTPAAVAWSHGTATTAASASHDA